MYNEHHNRPPMQETSENMWKTWFGRSLQKVVPTKNASLAHMKQPKLFNTVECKIESVSRNMNAQTRPERKQKHKQEFAQQALDGLRNTKFEKSAEATRKKINVRDKVAQDCKVTKNASSFRRATLLEDKTNFVLYLSIHSLQFANFNLHATTASEQKITESSLCKKEHLHPH